MRLLITGASGFIGRSLVSHCYKKKWHVVPLFHEIKSNGETGWKTSDASSLEGFDAVIHLAGEPLSLEHWSHEKRQKILLSRSEGTKSLSLALAHLRRPPALFLSASAIGIYGNRGEELLDEGSAPGKGFLAHVSTAWEVASRAIEDRGARIVHARFGMVLGQGGGTLAKLTPLYRMGLGAKLSTGEQWISWIALSDLILALDHILHKETLHGPINLVSPHAVRQKEFSRILAKILHRPAFFTLPAWLLRLVFGSVADELLLSSARVVPQKLCASGFHFKYSDLSDALQSILIDNR